MTYRVKVGKRKTWIDYMKVLGMVLIIWGHCMPGHLSAFVYAFDVPLFFWVSGYLSKQEKLPWKKFIKKICHSLVVPMLLICCISLLMGTCMGRYPINNLAKSVLLVLSGFHSYDGIAGCGGMWFVYTLLVIKVIHNALVSNFILQSAIVCIFIFVAAWYGNQSFGIYNAWINILLAYPFFMLGYLCSSLWKKTFDKFCNIILSSPCGIQMRTIAIAATTLFLFIMIFLLALHNGIAYMYEGEYGNNIFIFFLSSLLGIIAMIMLCSLIGDFLVEKIAILSFGTILILGFHSLFIRVLTAILRKFCISQFSWSFDVLSFIGSIGIILVFYPIIIATKHYVPFLLGGRK